jgi:hypothetical protein
MKKLFFGLFSLTLLATACKKDKDAPAVEPTKENLAGTYKVTAIAITVAGVPGSYDGYNDLEACEKDDQYKLNLDNSFEYIDAGTACDPNGGYTGEWSLSDHEVTFGDVSGTITKFDGTTVEVTATTTEQEVTMTIKSTFKKL